MIEVAGSVGIRISATNVTSEPAGIAGLQRAGDHWSRIWKLEAEGHHGGQDEHARHRDAGDFQSPVAAGEDQRRGEDGDRHAPLVEGYLRPGRQQDRGCDSQKRGHGDEGKRAQQESEEQHHRNPEPGEPHVGVDQRATRRHRVAGAVFEDGVGEHVCEQDDPEERESEPGAGVGGQNHVGLADRDHRPDQAGSELRCESNDRVRRRLHLSVSS